MTRIEFLHCKLILNINNLGPLVRASFILNTNNLRLLVWAHLTDGLIRDLLKDRTNKLKPSFSYHTTIELCLASSLSHHKMVHCSNQQQEYSPQKHHNSGIHQITKSIKIILHLSDPTITYLKECTYNFTYSNRFISLLQVVDYHFVILRLLVESGYFAPKLFVTVR